MLPAPMIPILIVESPLWRGLIAPSGRQTRVVFSLQTQPAVPERRGFLAADACGQNVEVRVPASADVEQRCAVRRAAMHDGEHHVLTSRLKFEGNGALLTPGDGELARRVERGDARLH